MVSDGPTALVIDFDGTAAEKNVGMAMIKHFARDDSWMVIDEEYGRGTVGSRHAYRLMGPLLTEGPDAWRVFALEHRLDPWLGELVSGARSAGWLVEILSDGLDVYIDPLLKRAAIDLPVRAANLIPNDAGGVVNTPFLNPLCGRCATCKTERILELSKLGYYVIFVGDGFSDICAAPKAHRIFAKDVLARHLSKVGAPFDRFETLTDVTRTLFGRADERD